MIKDNKNGWKTYNLDQGVSFLTIYMQYFFDQTPRLLFISLFILCGYLFEGGIYFFGKATDINYSLIRYIRVRQ